MLRAGLIVAALIMVGRLSGFAREWLLAVKAGASETTDVAIILLTFPDLMVGLLLGGGLAATLIPAFKRLGPGGDSALFLQALRWVGIPFTLLAASLALLAPWVLAVLAPGLPNSVLDPHVNHFRLVTVALPLAALSGVTVALLNANGRFALGASGTLVFNLMVIACLLLAEIDQTVAAVAVGAAAGSLLRLIMQAGGLQRDWRRPTIQGRLVDTALVRQFIASASFLTLLVLLPPLARAIASFGETGSLSLFNYAHKLVELPMGVIIGSIGTVLLPRLAGDFVGSGQAAAQTSLVAGMRATLLISLGIAIPAAVFADVLVQLAFFKAAFDAEQLRTLSTLTAVGFLFLPFQGLLNIYGTAFAASGNTRPLAWAALSMLGLIAIAAPAAQALFGLTGVMLAYGGVYLFGTVLLSWQIASVFGPSTLATVMGNAHRTLLIPGFFAAIVALIGDNIAVGMPARGLWALASFAGFLACVAVLDTSLRRWLTRFIGRTGN